MKKLILFVLVICLTFGCLAGCTSKTEAEPAQQTPAPAAEPVQEAPAPAPAEEETPEEAPLFADTVVYGTIWTAEDENGGLAEAFAVRDGKYIYVGDKAGAAQYIDAANTEIIDKTDAGLIIPGCTESHAHFFGIDAVMKVLPGFGMNYEELTDLIATEYKYGLIDKFFSYGLEIVKMEFDPENADRCFAEELEQIAPGIPVVLVSNDAHSAMCNTTALQMAGFLDSQDLRGAKFGKTTDGRLNGIVMDQGLPYVIDNVIGNMLSPDEYRAACEIAIANLHERGFTNCLDAWTNFVEDSAVYKYISELDSKGLLNMNVAACYNIHSYDADRYQEMVDHVSELAETYSTEHFNAGFIKLFCDGVVETKTGWTKGEYKDTEPGEEHGNKVWEPEELTEIVKYANSKGILVHTHAYGDAACEAIADAYAESADALGTKFRNSMGHLRNVTPETMRKMAEYGIAAAENMIWHAFSPIVFVKDQYPEGIAEYGYPMKSFLNNGIVLCSSTDSPCGESIKGTVMNIIEVAVTGEDYHTRGEEPPYWTEELLTVEEALKTLTINSAWLLGMEEERGSIKEGKFADYSVLDKNILEFEGDQLHDLHKVQINEIYFEGERVY